MLRSADAVWVMTRAHRTAVLSLEPSADGKVELLDPSGKDVSDPIGSPQSRYDEVARRMEMVIRERLRPREA
jgi:protein-tyrosine-phosphatase